MQNVKTEIRPPFLSAYSGIIMVGGLFIMFTTLLVPLPTAVMDMLLAGSLSLAIAVLVVTLSAKEALELSSFPSLLLFVTLFRLTINVASTRLILLQANAGKIIQTFGDLVAGNSFIVGMVIFLILVVIQFIVVTKGAERISEVSARFTLDAMPGKQMAIDADLNAGAITEQQANERRAKIVKESEFYGAMDGASKFIRGDAKAGLVITAVNLIGGIAMGYSRGMSIPAAIKTYSLLSIGDGLVTQIPAVIISVSSGFLVTKISSKYDIGQDLAGQFMRVSRPMLLSSIIITTLAFVPGMPPIPFLLLGGTVFFVSRAILKIENAEQQKVAKPAEAAKPEQEPVENLLDVDRISVNVGVRLISLVDPRKKTTIFERIGALRRRFAQHFGIIIPLVRVRDNITLEPAAYEIRLSDLPVASGRLEPDMYLAMDAGNVQRKVSGVPTTEPVYGLPALWITPDKKGAAELGGYTVIDPESVFITHLSETLKKHAGELLTREDLQTLLDRLRATQPSLVGDVVGELVPTPVLHRVLKNLLKNQIPVRELPVILESLAEHASRTKNAGVLTELVRKSLARTITQMYRDDKGRVSAIVFEPHLEEQLVSTIRPTAGGAEEVNLAIPAELAIDMGRKVAMAWKRAMDKGLDKIILLCDSRLRSALAAMLARTVPMLPVIAYDEILQAADIEPVETIAAQAELKAASPAVLRGASAKGEKELVGAAR
jgi:flagellar biosynthesis protein FlhA